MEDAFQSRIGNRVSTVASRPKSMVTWQWSGWRLSRLGLWSGDGQRAVLERAVGPVSAPAGRRVRWTAPFPLPSSPRSRPGAGCVQLLLLSW